MSAGIVAEVGKFYRVPCMYTANRGFWIPSDGWVPVLGPKHEDAEHLKLPSQHYHVDWRFIPKRKFDDASSFSSPLGHVLTNTGLTPGQHCLTGEPVTKRRKCLRSMPTFPVRPGPGWAQMERAQFAACPKLKPGNICPHRGIDLTPFEQEDGTAICPGHGLHWNLRTGDLIPRHATGAAT